MKSAKLLDLYSDFLTSSPNIVSALIMSSVLQDAYSDDSITRMLAQPELDPKDYWRLIKPTVRRIESDSDTISVDDTLEHKPYSDENDLIAWHHNHNQSHIKFRYTTFDTWYSSAENMDFSSKTFKNTLFAR